MALEPSNTGNCGVIEPGQDDMKAIAQSFRKPLRLVLELIGSMAAAAADFEGNTVEKGQKLGMHPFENTPTANEATACNREKLRVWPPQSGFVGYRDR